MLSFKVVDDVCLHKRKEEYSVAEIGNDRIELEGNKSK